MLTAERLRAVLHYEPETGIFTWPDGSRMRNNVSGRKGVSWHKGNRKWRAQITVEHKDTFLGYFDDVEEAADAYNAAALKYHGEFARLDL